MKKRWLAWAAGLFFVTNAANAISMSGEGGQHYTSLGIGVGASTSGVGLNGGWTRSDHDGNVGYLGLGFNLPVGPMMVTVGGKALYLAPRNGKSGSALALGGGMEWPINHELSLHGEEYFSPDSLTSGVKAYNEVGGGLRWNIFRPLSVDVGYRYMQLKGKDGHRNSTLADGPYVGCLLGF
ncbi:YfaZ family outer membrane protein [Trabulsiella odontotermitis]|uniref:Porin n=1 Tax=Trabulsiella odontotermitis TaxID=379893 RepID=A0A0L0GW41_9ENTR|nr:YfaZ family outer membrane protein [Trabulsiella odontotermitis]KNC93365.1 porin [Trabulsiella odontotermitis]